MSARTLRIFQSIAVVWQALLLGMHAQTLGHDVDTGGGYSITASADVGDLFTHRFQYNFPSGTFTNASVVFQLPADVEYLSKGTTSHIDNASYDAVGHTLTFTFVSPLPSSISGELLANVRFPGGTYTGTLATSSATLSWEKDSVSDSITTTPDVEVTATNGDSPPSISNGVGFSAWNGHNLVYLGSGHYFVARHGTYGGELIPSYIVEQRFPKEFVFEWWRHNVPFQADHNFTVNYETNAAPGVWNPWKAGTFSSDDNTHFYASSLSLGANEYITALQFDYGAMLPGPERHFDQGARILMMGDITTKNINGLSQDIDGGAVTVGTDVVSTATLSTAGQYPIESESTSATIDPDTATADVFLRFVTSGPYNPGEVVRQRFFMESPPANIYDLVNPTLAYLLPPQMEYVGNVSTNAPAAPTTTFTPDWDSTGRPLLMFQWAAATSNAVSVSPDTEWTNINVEFDVRIVNPTADGNYTSETLGWLENASYACQWDEAITDTHDLDNDTDRSERLCGEAASFEVFADTNAATATIIASDAIVPEGSGTANVQISLTATSGVPITVDYATSDGSAEGGSDFTATSGTATIPAGATSVSIPITLLDDILWEGTEEFYLDLSNPSGAPIADSQATVTINDNDMIPTAPGDSYFIHQNTDTLYTIDLATGTPTALGSTTATGRMNALAFDEDRGLLWYIDGGSYELYSFNVGTATEIGLFADLGDAMWTDPVTGGLADGGAWYDGAYYVGTASSDNLYRVSFDAGYTTVKDVVKVADINGDSSGVAWGDFAITSSGILYGADAITGAVFKYDLSTNGPRVEIASGTAVNGIQIGGDGRLYGIQSGAADGPLYTINVTSGVTSPHALTGLVASPGDLAGPVVPEPVGTDVELLVRGASVNEAASSVTFSIELTAFSTAEVTVDYATASNTALAGDDFTTTTGSVTFTPGVRATTVTVPIIDDLLVEGPEAFFINLSNPVNATIADAQAEISIDDNDTAAISVSDTSVSEAASSVAVTISLSATSALPVSVDYATVNSTASAGSDYTATSGTATIPAGTSSFVVNVPLLDDAIAEGEEAFLLGLSNASGATITDAQATISITDNDAADLSVADTSIAEGGSTVDVTINLSSASVAPVSFDFRTFDDSAEEGDDYTGNSGTATIPAGSSSATVTIAILDDVISEGNEQFTLDISDATGGAITDGSGVITIIDDDSSEISIADIVASEGGGNADVVVLLSAVNSRDVEVSFATANSSAITGSDYTAVSGSVTVPAGDSSAVIAVPILDDSLFERNETFSVGISSPVNGTITDNEAIVTILDNECDETPYLIQTADLHGVDFQNASTNLLASSIAAYSINAIGYNRTDHFLWGFKQVSPWNTVVRINADYSVTEFVIPGLSADSYHIGDVDGSGVMHVGRANSKVVKRIDVNPNSPNYLKVLPDLLLSDDDDWGDWAFHAIDGNLYTIDRSEKLFRIDPSSGLVTELGKLSGIRGSGFFGACYCDGLGAFYALREENGIIYRLPDVHLLTGATKPEVEFFSKAPSGWSSDGARCALAPPPAGPLRVNVEDALVTEDMATVDVTIRLTDPAVSAVSVDYTTLNNTATSGTDYIAKSGMVIFPAGSTTQTVSVSLVPDDLPEGQESFFVTITNPTGGAILADDAGIISITDDDATDTDRDGAPDVDDIDDDNDGILDVDEALVNATCPNNVEVIILLDNSGSISAAEWDSFSAFTRDVIDELGASGTVRMAVAHYWSDWLAIKPELYLESDFTTDPSVAKMFERRGIGQDELHRTIPLLRNALDGSGAGVSGGTTTLTHLPGSEVHVLFMTDAAKSLFGGSDLVDPNTPGDPYKFMNDFKKDFGVTVTGVRFDTGWAPSDAEANAAVAALSSVGGIYTGTIDTNATDPQGSGVIPRRFYNVNNFGGIPGTLAAEIADLTCESTQDFDNDGFPDHLDIDSDNDGIPDNVEAQATGTYKAPNGDSGPVNSGLDTAYTGGLSPVDSDQDGTVDVYDLDSDSDGIPDVEENNDSDDVVTGNDSDMDGLDNAFDSENVLWDPNDHIDDPNPTTLGDNDGDLAPNGNNATAMIRDVDYRDPGKQNSYTSWKSLYALALGAESNPDDNPDGDLYDNLLEYAICLHPGSGVPGPGGFFLGADGGGALHARFYRPKGGLSDVTYEIHGRADLPVLESEVWSIMFTIPGNGSAPTGVTVTDYGNAIEEVRIDDLQDYAPVSQESGFIRLAVSYGAQKSYAPVWGWTETVVEAGNSETYANPFLQPEQLSGVISTIVGTHGVDVSKATGGVPLESDILTAKNDYYLEVVGGDLEGHRFDISSVVGTTIHLAADSDVYAGPPYNTLVTPVGIPAELVGDRFVLRRHHALDDFFPPGDGTFTPQAHTFVVGHPADRVHLYEGGSWEPFWLYDNATGTGGPIWDRDGDDVFVDEGGKAIPPGTGVFLAPQETTVILTGIGIVRKNAFAMPLPKGWSLQASPFPLDQGPAERFMNHQTFDGSEDPSTSDTVCFWLGNGDTYKPEFRCAFLFEPQDTQTPRWLYADDEFLTPRDFETEIFPRDRSSFYFRYQAAKPAYVIPLPWCIDLIGE